jgi:ATP-dependent Clp protease adapter protein ClpS
VPGRGFVCVDGSATLVQLAELDAYVRQITATIPEHRRVMITAHMRGSCVVAVFTRDIAESKASEATEAGRSAGHPLSFTTEPEE